MIIGYAHAKLLFASLSTSDMLSCCITASRLMAPRSHQGLATFGGSTCPIANQVPSFIHIESFPSVIVAIPLRSWIETNIRKACYEQHFVWRDHRRFWTYLRVQPLARMFV